MLNNNKAANNGGETRRTTTRRKKNLRASSESSYGECVTLNIGLRRFPSCRQSRPSGDGMENFTSPIFISFVLLRVYTFLCLAFVFSFLLLSCLLFLRVTQAKSSEWWQDILSSECLIFRKRSQEILIGILCIYVLKQSNDVDKNRDEEKRKRNCLNTKN